MCRIISSAIRIFSLLPFIFDPFYLLYLSYCFSKGFKDYEQEWSEWTTFLVPDLSGNALRFFSIEEDVGYGLSCSLIEINPRILPLAQG